MASVATYADRVLRPADVRELLTILGRLGYQRAMTAALMPDERVGFEACGFTTVRRLALLRRGLHDPVPGSRHGLRRWRRRSLDPVLAVDRAAFDEFWHFDTTALRDAMSATPHRLLRVPRGDPPTAYALSGLSGERGYVQRLAVMPDHEGEGLGTSLLLDALRWMRWRGAAEVFVNTQTDNERAMALYRRHGFETQPVELEMLDIGL